MNHVMVGAWRTFFCVDDGKLGKVIGHDVGNGIKGGPENKFPFFGVVR